MASKSKANQTPPEINEVIERMKKRAAGATSSTSEVKRQTAKVSPPQRPQPPQTVQPKEVAQPPVPSVRPPVNRDALRRVRAPVPKPPPEPPSVNAGSVDKVTDMMLNPSRDAIRGMTIIDRIQGRTFPLMDMVRYGVHYILEIAEYRQDKERYKEKYDRDRPEQPELSEEFMFRTAQWQKSVNGTNLTRASEIALAEKESQSDEEDYGGGADKYLQDT